MPFGPGPNQIQQPFTPDPLVQASAAFQAIPAVHQTPLMAAMQRAVAASAQNATNPNIAQGTLNG
jgi:hypothetical protein